MRKKIFEVVISLKSERIFMLKFFRKNSTTIPNLRKKNFAVDRSVNGSIAKKKVLTTLQ